MQQRKLFDVLVVVGLKQEQQKDKVKIVPFVKYQYPSTLSSEIQNTLMRPINEFCFPDVSRYLPENYNWRKKVKSETFSFVLTEGTGDKRWGYCRMTVPGGVAKSATDYPICFCIASLVPCFNIFSQILNQMDKQTEHGSFDSCNSFLGSIYNQPLPPPGGTLMADGITFSRPNDSDSLLDHVNFEPLLRFLDTNTILSLFASLLVERRIIFTADNLSTLSTTVQAAIAVLYPFIWQHIFIPVLPQSLMSFCCAPMPFVVGILRSSIPELEMMQRSGAVEEVLFIDIDKNKVTFPTGMDDAHLLPRSITEPLATAIENTSRAVKQKYANFLKRGVRRGGGPKPAPSQRKGEMSKVDTKDFANAFIGFMVDLLGDYRNFITPNDQKKFDLEGFIKHKPSEMSELLKLVGECQMFEMFIRDRMTHPVPKAGKPAPPVGGKFEKRMTTYGGGGGGGGSGATNGTNTKKRGGLHNSTVPNGNNNNSANSSPNGSDIGGKAALTRFTMYEMGDISRDDVTKSVAPLSSSNGLMKSSGGAKKDLSNLSFSVDHGSFKKLATAEDLRSKDKRQMLGIDLDNENALTLLVGSGGSRSFDSLPPPPAPPGGKGPAPQPPKDSLATTIGEASAHLSARITSAAAPLARLTKKGKLKPSPPPSVSVSQPMNVKQGGQSTSVTAKTLNYEYAQQDVHPSRGPSDATVRAGPRAEKAKSMSVLQVERGSNIESGAGSPSSANSTSKLPRPSAGSGGVKARTAEINKKETQDVLKKWRDN